MTMGSMIGAANKPSPQEGKTPSPPHWGGEGVSEA